MPCELPELSRLDSLAPPRPLLPLVQDLLKLDDFEGTIVPVVTPADDDVCSFNGVTVAEEVEAFKFKFDTGAAEAAGGDFPHGLTVRKAGLDTQNGEAETASHSAEEEEHAILIAGSEYERSEAERDAVGGRLIWIAGRYIKRLYSVVYD